VGSPGSRAWRFRTCPGSLTARGPSTTRGSAAAGVAFHVFDRVGTPNTLITRLHSPACTCPYRCFATPSRVVDARLGVTVGRYPFGVELFHLLLHAGFIPALSKDHMPVSSPFLIVLSDPERRELSRRARSTRTPHRDRIRARIVLAAADSDPNAVIARRVGVGVDTVRKWRKRFAAERLVGLRDAARPGRPRRLPDAARAEVIALACELPVASGVPLSRWSSPELARELAARCRVRLSASTVRRWLAADALKPWQHQSWISIRDPDFAIKATAILDLYARSWDEQPLGRNDYVICADEKTSIQARCRCHPTLAPGQARAMRVEHDYQRRGALAYLAAWDVHRGQVMGRCEHTTGIEPFARLVEQVMTTEPYASADRVFWVVDNGSSHRGQPSIDRLRQAWPNTHLVHTPVHASWLNQCEIYFSVLQRKVLTPNDFTDTDQIRQRVAAFEARYNAIASPFAWRFTRTDLDDLLDRLAAHASSENDHLLAA
jgi:transposase